MSDSSDTGSAPSTAPGGARQESASAQPPKGWEAVIALASSRIELIRLESKDAAKNSARRVVMLLIAVGCVFFGWVLLLAGGVAWVAAAAGWSWYWVALGLAALHLAIAALLVTLAKPSGSPTFPHTRAEFQKDREWIKNFQETRKSNG